MAVKKTTLNKVLTVGSKSIYDTKVLKTVPVKIIYSGFSMQGKYAFYASSKLSKKEALIYFSKSTLLRYIKNGTIK